MRKKSESTEFIKKCLAQALIDIMWTKEYKRISITEICNKAGYGRTTYYRHFDGDKDEALLYIAHIEWKDYKAKHPIECKENE